MVLQFPMSSNIALPDSIGYILTMCKEKYYSSLYVASKSDNRVDVTIECH